MIKSEFEKFPKSNLILVDIIIYLLSEFVYDHEFSKHLISNSNFKYLLFLFDKNLNEDIYSNLLYIFYIMIEHKSSALYINHPLSQIFIEFILLLEEKYFNTILQTCINIFDSGDFKKESILNLNYYCNNFIISILKNSCLMIIDELLVYELIISD